MSASTRSGKSATSNLPGRYGQPWHQDAGGRWQPTAGCVLGMGKLGGQELNYSSDVDVLFVYSEEGSVFKEPPGGQQGAPASADQPSVLQPPGRGLHRRGEPHDAGRGAVSDRSAAAARGRCGPAEPFAGRLRELLRAVGPDLGADDADQSARRGGRRDAGGGVSGDDPALPVSAVRQRERAARGRGHEGPHRDTRCSRPTNWSAT